MKLTKWVLDQLPAHRPVQGAAAGRLVGELLSSLSAVRSASPEGQVLGLSASSLEPEGRPAVEAAIVETLAAWRSHFDAEADVVSLLELDGAGRRLNLPDLLLTKRFPLRCDPLGTRDDLAADWLRRLERLDEAIAGRRALRGKAVQHVGSELREVTASFGAPDEEALYAFVLRYEASRRKPFPRELAAFWSTANGISLGDDPILRAVRYWEWEDEGLCIGCGGDFQGSLIVQLTSKKGLLEAKVVDLDDDAEKRARYASLGAFVDALLGD